MAKRFPHLKSDSSFPDVQGVDVYKYDNDFDYSRYDAQQMELQLCSVPWDNGEAHVGQRTLSGIGNVVYFETKERRDAWFDAIPDDACYRWSTKYKALHVSLEITVPLPFDVATKYNYLRVKYSQFANDDSPVEYEKPNGMRDWFWFIRNAEMLSADSTKLTLLADTFQTFIYEITLTGMILERGHAPMFATRATEYLANPLENNEGLLCEDVSFGKADIVKSTDALVLNSGDMWACVASTGNPTGTWGSKAEETWQTWASAYYNQNGCPSVYVFAMETTDLNNFLANVSNDYPQFKQTIQAVFFAPKDLVTVAGLFTFAGIDCQTLQSSRQRLDFLHLDKGAFGYPSEYADIAKLYTSPYAHIEVTDENGNIDIIRIEDTTGDIQVSAALSLAYPYINIQAHLLGTGGSNSRNISFRNLTNRTMPIGGKWYDTLRTWEVPTFAVVQGASREYDYQAYFDRQQAYTDYQTEYSNVAASAATEQTNANASANAAATNTATMAAANKANADRSANTDIDNTALQVAANNAVNTTSNAAAKQDTWLANAYATACQAWEAGYTNETTNNEIQAEWQSGAVSAAGTVASGIASAISNPIGAAGSLVGAAINGACTIGQTAIAANLKSEQAQATIGLSQNKLNETNQNNDDRTGNQTGANTDNVATNNKYATGSTANSAATQKTNASATQSAENTAAGHSRDVAVANSGRTYDTTIANAERSRDRAKEAIENKKKQAALNAPTLYGDFANGENAPQKPMALFANIVTQSKSAIKNAGDEFLRYGYRYDGQWEFDGSFNIGKYFTFWQLRDFWTNGYTVADEYMDKIRFFLFGGVTVWRRPEDIGKVSIYDNFQ